MNGQNILQSLLILVNGARRLLMPAVYAGIGAALLVTDFLGQPLLSTALGLTCIAYGLFRAALAGRGRFSSRGMGGRNLIGAGGVLLVLGATSCRQEKGPDLDTPTSGRLVIAVDESYRPVLDAEITVFDSLYRLADLEPVYGPMRSIIEQLLTDSVQVAVLPRALSPDELEHFRARRFTPRTTLIARDGLALIVHPANPDSSLTVETVRRMLSGEITDWKDVSGSSTLGGIRLVFDHPLSGAVQYAVDSICDGRSLSAQASALRSSEEVIRYVAANPAALGIIGVNWISDFEDPQAQEFLKEVRVATVAREPGEQAFQPYQAYLATGDYPFIRSVYIVNAQARPGLGMGFASFLASERGQRILLKSGLLPATQPIRLVRFN